MNRFIDRVALITGGASGIGASTAQRILDEGGSVVIADIQDDLGREQVAGWGEAAHYVHLDVTSEREWTTAIDATL